MNTEEAFDTALEYTIKYDLHMYGFSTEDLWELYTYSWTTIYSSMPMWVISNKLGDLPWVTDSAEPWRLCALIDLSRCTFTKSYIPKYARYVDDVGTTVNNTVEAKVMLNYLSWKHPTIQFEMELPGGTRFLPILDLNIKINEHGKSSENGTLNQ